MKGIFTRKFDQSLKACDLCGTPGPSSHDLAITSYDSGRDSEHDASIPPGLYDYLCTICHECAQSPSICLTRGRQHLERVANRDNLMYVDWCEVKLGILEDAVKAGLGFSPLPDDGILLPVHEWEDVVLQDGRWVVVAISNDELMRLNEDGTARSRNEGVQ